MPWQRSITFGVLLLALAVLAAWQWDEYGHECELARESVSRAADSVMNALVGGVQSHRRLGQFFAENIQGALDGLAVSKDVRAVAVVSEDGKSVLAAGAADLLDLAPPFESGERWDPAGFRLVHTFRLPAESGGPGGGRGGGRGWGRRWQTEPEDSETAFASGEMAAAILVVDRGRADQECRHAAWLRGSIVAAGWAVVLCVALAWRATIRLADARGRQRTLELEARHFRDLSQAALGLAHETRNPLGLIRGWTQRLENEIHSREGRQQVRAVLEECDRVTARINHFLAFARPAEPKLDQFDPAQVVEELAVLLEPDLSAKRLTIPRMAPCGMVLADREMFRQALFNLLQNAAHASPENAAVEVTAARRQNGHWRIEVADRGQGVPREAIDRLFTPYFTTREGGTGLGLAIVRRIAAVHGWDAGYSARPGGGAVFWLDGIHE